jgi:hypothetical protein
MDAQTLRNDLQDAGFRLVANGDSLTIEPASRLTPALRDSIRANKPALLRLISEPTRHARIRVTDRTTGETWEGATSPPVTLSEAERLWPGSDLEMLPDPSCAGWFGDSERDVRRMLALLGCGPDHQDFPDAIATAERHVTTTLEGLRESVRRESEGVAP